MNGKGWWKIIQLIHQSLTILNWLNFYVLCEHCVACLNKEIVCSLHNQHRGL